MGNVFLGSKKLGLKVVSALLEAAPGSVETVITIDDQKDERNVFEDFRTVIPDLGSELVVVRTNAEAKTALLRRHPQKCFCCGWYWLFDQETIDIVRGGIFGVHNSLLPKYRGGAPLVWALMNGEPRIGLSVFRIGPGMDDGDVYGRFGFDIGPDTHIGEVLEILETQAPARIGAIWQDILSGTAIPEPQDERDATYGGMRYPEDGRIDWSRPAQFVHNFVRAQSPPYPGAFTCISDCHAVDRTMVITRTRVYDGLYFNVPGRVLRRAVGSVLVGCGENTALDVTAVMVHGKALDPAVAIPSIRTILT